MGWLQKLFYGVDVDAEVERGQKLDQGIAEYQAKQYASGAWTASEYDQAKQNAGKQAATTYNAQVDAEFRAGLAEGKSNVSGAISGTLNAAAQPFLAVLGGIPAWLWLIGGGLLAWKLGLLDGLFKRKA